MQTVAFTTSADDADVPDTLRDRDLSGGTEPMEMPPVTPRLLTTKPLARPVEKAGVKTKPLTPPIAPPPSPRDRAIAPTPAGRPSFEVYNADDTYAGNVPVELPLDDETRQYRIGLGVFGAAVILVTSLAAIGSCDDKPTPGSVETTAATISAPASPVPPASVLAPTVPVESADTKAAPPLPTPASTAPKKKKKH